MFQSCLQSSNSEARRRAEATIDRRKQEWEKFGLTYKYDIDDQLIPYQTKTLLSEDIIKEELDPLKPMNIRLYKDKLKKYPDKDAKELIEKTFEKAKKLIVSQEQLATGIFKNNLVTMQLNPLSDEFTRKVEWAKKTAETADDLKKVKLAAAKAKKNNIPRFVFANNGYEASKTLKITTENKIKALYDQISVVLDPDFIV